MDRRSWASLGSQLLPPLQTAITLCNSGVFTFLFKLGLLPVKVVPEAKDSDSGDGQGLADRKLGKAKIKDSINCRIPLDRLAQMQSLCLHFQC
jgi:hypothetical protein